MQRVTVKDPEQTISFLTDADIAVRLIAGCSANPDTIGELLLATEVFRRGIAGAVMTSLITFDKALQRSDRTQAFEMATTTDRDGHVVWGAFQVVDDRTKARAHNAADTPLLILDLPARVISASPSIRVQPSGEILAHNGKELTGRAITYVLPQEWTVRSL